MTETSLGSKLEDMPCVILVVNDHALCLLFVGLDEIDNDPLAYTSYAQVLKETKAICEKIQD